jgi:hypothetical protein
VGHVLARACAQGAGYSSSRQQAAQGRKERGSQRKKKESGKKLEERNKMDLNKI